MSETTCELCGEAFMLERSVCKHGDLPTDFHLYVVHDHETYATPTWVACLFHRAARERWSPTAKEIMELRKANVRKAKAMTQAEKDAAPERLFKNRCSIGAFGCDHETA